MSHIKSTPEVDDDSDIALYRERGRKRSVTVNESHEYVGDDHLLNDDIDYVDLEEWLRDIENLDVDDIPKTSTQEQAIKDRSYDVLGALEVLDKSNYSTDSSDETVSIDDSSSVFLASQIDGIDISDKSTGKRSSPLKASNDGSKVAVDKFQSKYFRMCWYEVCKALNNGDIHYLTSVIRRFVHPRCLFRVNDTIQTVQYFGNESVISFYNGVLQAFPDTVVVSKKVKTFVADKFLVLQTKAQHVGTELSGAFTVECLNLGMHLETAQYMKITDPDLKQKLIDIEKAILASGRKVVTTCDVVTTIYIDPKINKVVLYDIGFRVISFRPSLF